MIDEVYKSVGLHTLTPDARHPTRSTAGAAAYDLFNLDDVVLSAVKSRQIVRTGLAIELPHNHVGLVCSRSGLATRGVFVINAPGIIDEDYRGEVKVILGFLPSNLAWPDPEIVHLPAGSRIAQFLVLPRPAIVFSQLADLSATERGDGGLGSTGT